MHSSPGSRPGASYILRGGDDGAARLRILAHATWPTTLRLLLRAGIGPGLRVLDVGCGSGEVTVELARMVAPTGHVTGLDADARLVERARARAAADGVVAVFVHGDALGEFPGSDGHDVVYARFLLSHLASPLAALDRMRAATRPGGLVAVEDVDFPGHFCDPPCEAFARFVELYQAAARCRGGDPAIGPRLPALLRAAGFANVQLDVVQPTFLEGEGMLVAQLTMEAIRPAVVEAGLASNAEVDAIVDELDVFRRTPGTLQSIARIVQAWGSRPA